MLNLCKIWIEKCEAARGIEDQFGTVSAMKYLVGEKFLQYLDAAERDAEFRAELPAFVSEIKTIFERCRRPGAILYLGVDCHGHSIVDHDDELVRTPR